MTEAQEKKNASTKSQPTGDGLTVHQLSHEKNKKNYDILWNTTGCFIGDPYNGLL